MSSSSPATLPAPAASPANEDDVSQAGRWMALAAALLGWMFDGAEMGVFSMVGRDAIKNLLTESSPPGTAVPEGDVGFLFGIVIAMFLVGAATGGVLFGWLGDRIGRVRAMTLSVLCYALFTGLTGLATNVWQIAALRFIAALGMGGEWSLGVALVMEVWPNRSRALMAGLIGAAANVGYLLVGFIGLGLEEWLPQIADGLRGTGLSEASVTWLTAFKGWRLLMILGTTPALLTFFIRIFVPESQKWEQEQEKGGTSHWATEDLLGVLIGALGPALIIGVWAVRWETMEGFANWGALIRWSGTILGLAIATGGYIYPVYRYLRRLEEAEGKKPEESKWGETLGRMLIGAVLSGVALMGTWGSTQWAPSWSRDLVDNADKAAAAKASATPSAAAAPVSKARAAQWTQIASAFGACLGTILAALAGDWLGRRFTYCLMCIASLLSALALYQLNTEYNTTFLVYVFILGATTASFYGWLPLYLPELFATKVRATGQGFGFNFGRIIAAIGALNTGALTTMFVEPVSFLGLTFRPGYSGACTAISFIYLAGLALIWLAPETGGKDLPE